MILSARMAPGALSFGSSRRRTSRWVSVRTHAVYSSRAPAAYNPPTAAPMELPATLTISYPRSSSTWMTPMWA